LVARWARTSAFGQVQVRSVGAILELAELTLQVVECHRVTGEENVLLKVQAADMDELTDVVDLFFALGQITTSIVQRSPVPPRCVPLPAEY